MFYRTILWVASSMIMQMSASGASKAAPVVYGNQYMEETIKYCDSPLIVCNIPFSRTPPGKYLTIQHASCFIDLNLPLVLARLTQSTSSEGLVLISYPLSFAATLFEGRYYYNIGSQTSFKMTSLKFPGIALTTVRETQYSVRCTIIGTLSTS